MTNYFLLNIAEHEKFSANKYEIVLACSYLLAEKISCSEHENSFITSEPDCVDAQADLSLRLAHSLVEMLCLTQMVIDNG